MKYKVGDIVKLRDDLVSGKVYGDIAYTGYMDYLKKQPSTIEMCIEDGLPNRYKTKENWVITDEMIEGLWEENKPKYKLIDILNKIANGELKYNTKIIWDEREYTYKGDNEVYRKMANIEIDLWNDMCMDDLESECELIEPDHIPDVGKMAEHFREDTKMIEPAECEHKWKKYSLGKRVFFYV